MSIENKCEELGFSADPTVVITDFEQAVLNAFRNVFGQHVQHRGCFFHLTQSTWRKIQQLQLVPLYKADDHIKVCCGMLDALAFLPVDRVLDGMEYVKEIAPEALDELLKYFDRTYVSGTFRRIQPVGNDQAVQPLRVRRIPPLFPIGLWNVHEVTLANEDRTNNLCESWNNRFQKLIGYDHPTVWVAIEMFRKDQSEVETALFNNANGIPLTKRVKKVTSDLQERLRNLCEDFVNDRKAMDEFLHAVARTIRWKC